MCVCIYVSVWYSPLPLCCRIYDLLALEERGSLLVSRKGSVAALASAGPSLCLCLSEDRQVSVWRVSDWTLLKTITTAEPRKEQKSSGAAVQKHYGHQLSVHPSCKLALCLNGTSALHLIDLLKGKCAATFALEERERNEHKGCCTQRMGRGAIACVILTRTWKHAAHGNKFELYRKKQVHPRVDFSVHSKALVSI